MFALTLPKRLPNFCSAIRATLGQRQFRQSPGLALNAHSGNEWGKIPVLTGLGWCSNLGGDIMRTSESHKGHVRRHCRPIRGASRTVYDLSRATLQMIVLLLATASTR